MWTDLERGEMHIPDDEILFPHHSHQSAYGEERTEGHGVFAPFFGIQTHTPVLLNRIAERSGAEILTVFAERLPKGRGFHIQIQRPDRAITGETPEQAAVTLNQEVERCVRQLPAQYQWTYKRFKTRPSEEKGNFWQLNPPVSGA